MSAIDQVGIFERKVSLLCRAFLSEFSDPTQKVHVGGREMTVGELVKDLQGMQELLEAVHRTHRSFRHAVAERRKAARRLRSLYEDTALFVTNQLGRENPRLATFGLRLRKARRPLSSSAKTIAQAKAAATRLARGTMGKKQRSTLTETPPTGGEGPSSK